MNQTETQVERQAEPQFELQSANRQKSGKSIRRKMFTLICYAYIFLGVCCIAAGGALYAMPFYMGSRHPVGGLLIVVLVGFGLARIGTAIINLRRLNRGRKSATISM